MKYKEYNKAIDDVVERINREVIKKRKEISKLTWFEKLTSSFDYEAMEKCLDIIEEMSYNISKMKKD